MLRSDLGEAKRFGIYVISHARIYDVPSCEERRSLWATRLKKCSIKAREGRRRLTLATSSAPRVYEIKYFMDDACDVRFLVHARLFRTRLPSQSVAR